MRYTLMFNLDEAHARQLDDLKQHFHLAAEDTARLAIRLTHARMKKTDVLVPELKPRAKNSISLDFDNDGPG